MWYVPLVCYRARPWRYGGAEEAGEEEGKYKANKCCVWAVGWGISIREAHVV